jgi:hypothetical protein
MLLSSSILNRPYFDKLLLGNLYHKICLPAHINAVAALTRVSGAAEYVNPDDYTVQPSRFPDCTPQGQGDG